MGVGAAGFGPLLASVRVWWGGVGWFVRGSMLFV